MHLLQTSAYIGNFAYKPGVRLLGGNFGTGVRAN